jgi:hypothetical protein
MGDVKLHDQVKFKDGRTGQVYALDAATREAMCAIDPADSQAGGASPSGRFRFDDLEVLSSRLPDE